MKNITPTKHYSSTLHQLCKLIRSHLTEKLARENGVDKKARTFTPWSHVVSLLFAQLTHAIGLNDDCDTLRHHAAKLRAIRGAVAPSRNTLSHANRERDSDMMEALFWKVLGHLQELSPGFGRPGATAACPVASNGRSMRSIPPPLPWWPTAWTGPSTVGARPRRRCTCG